MHKASLFNLHKLSLIAFQDTPFRLVFDLLKDQISGDSSQNNVRSDTERMKSLWPRGETLENAKRSLHERASDLIYF